MALTGFPGAFLTAVANPSLCSLGWPRAGAIMISVSRSVRWGPALLPRETLRRLYYSPYEGVEVRRSSSEATRAGGRRIWETRRPPSVSR